MVDRVHLAIGPWYGGVDYSTPQEKLPSNKLSAMLNMEVGDGGELVSSLGYDEYISTTFSGSPSVQLLGKHRFNASTSRAFCIAGTKFYEDVSGTWTDRTGAATITNNVDNVFSSASADGVLFFCSQTDGMFKWASAGGNIATASVSGRFTYANIVVWWNNRLWYANVSTGEDELWYSDISTPETIGANSFYIFGEAIIALVPVNQVLLVFTSSNVFTIYATNTAEIPYQRQYFASTTAVSKRATLVDTLGNVLIVEDDGIYELRGNVVTKISTALDGPEYWDLINKSRLTYSHAVLVPNKNQVWFFLPSGASQSTMNHIMVWNYVLRCWMGPRTDFSRNCSAYFDRYPHAGGNSDGKVWRHNYTTTNNGANLNAYAHLASPSAFGLGAVIRWDQAVHEFENVSTQTSVYITQISPGVGAKTDFIDLQPSGTPIGSFTIGVHSIGASGEISRLTTEMIGYDSLAQIRYQSSSLPVQIKIRQTELQGFLLADRFRPTPGLVE